MTVQYFLGENSTYMKEWCERNYAQKTYVEFDVIDSKDSTKLTSFTLLLDGNSVAYEVTSDNNIKLQVFKTLSFTVQIANCEGYVDGVANTYTTSLLNGSHIGLTKKTVETDNAEFKLDWSIDVSRDLDSHMVIKDANGNEIGHVSYADTTFEDATTKVTLDIDNVSREDEKPPEIISIEKINANYTYYYYVHDFSESGKLPQTNLNLNVVLKNQTVSPAITIPTAENSNSFWNVCKISNKNLTRASECISETVTSDPNTSY